MESHFAVTPTFAVKTLEKALKIYTPTLHEKGLADFLADNVMIWDLATYIQMK